MHKWTLCLAMLTLQAVAFAAEYGPAHHQGVDLTLVDGDVLWGEHTNVGRFVVPAGATANVKAMDRDSSTSPRLYGYLTIQAREIEVAGTLDASGAGYTGGGGGGWSWSSNPENAVPGKGDYYDDFGGFFTGGQGFWMWFMTWGGGGAPGDGPWSGDVRTGGYRAPGLNGDRSVDDGVYLGSGGSGGSVSDYGSRLGGGGGRGGGAIRLVAEDRLTVTGTILARGLWGQNTHGGAGGNSSPAEEGAPNGATAQELATRNHASFGGAGAGGGILLDAPNLTIAPSALISNTGGGDRTVNGGTVKIFADQLSLPPTTAGVIRTGRLFIPGPARTDAWVLE